MVEVDKETWCHETVVHCGFFLHISQIHHHLGIDEVALKEVGACSLKKLGY